MKKYNLVTSSVLQRVFNIVVGEDAGTAFIVERKNAYYLVTAKHIFKKQSYPKQTKIKIYTEGGFVELDNEIHYHTIEEVDIAVIKTDYFNGVSFEKVLYTSKETIFSQDVFMLGFPYGLNSGLFEINRGFPIPYIKKGILAGKSEKKQYVDWDNNQGFSGGPVVYRTLEEDGFSDEMYIAGVIKGYRIHEIEVWDKDNKEIIGYTKENSGLGIFYPIEFAIDIIDSIG